LPKSEEETRLAFQTGDFASSQSKAEEWLRVDPFSVDAYDLLAMSADRQASTTFSSRAADVVRSVIAINPNDSKANFLAVTFTSDPELALTFLKRLQGAYNYSAAAMNLALKYQDFQKRLDYLQAIPTEPELEMMKAQCLAALGELKGALAILTKEGFTESLQAQLSSVDPGYATGWAGAVGLIAHDAGDDKLARTWLEYGVSRDPNAQEVKNLANALQK
jgi:tetratricopeptide (TPR) repeat protein